LYLIVAFKLYSRLNGVHESKFYISTLVKRYLGGLDSTII